MELNLTIQAITVAEVTSLVIEDLVEIEDMNLMETEEDITEKCREMETGVETMEEIEVEEDFKVEEELVVVAKVEG